MERCDPGINGEYMAIIQIDIPAGVTNRILDAIALEYRYNANVDGTKFAFAKKQIIEFLKRTVKESEGSSQSRTVIQSVYSDVDSNVVIS